MDSMELTIQNNIVQTLPDSMMEHTKDNTLANIQLTILKTMLDYMDLNTKVHIQLTLQKHM